MTGNDLIYWFHDLWYDITHLRDADLFSLAWRLLLVFLVLRLLYGVFQRPAKRLVNSFRHALGYPARQIRRVRNARQRRRERELWEQQQQAEQTQMEAEREADRQRATAEREAIQRALSLDE